MTLTLLANKIYVQFGCNPRIHVLETGCQSGVRSCSLPELPTHLVQELNVGTVSLTESHGPRLNTARYMSLCKALGTGCLLSLTESHGPRLNTARYMSLCKALRTDCLLSLTESPGPRLNTAQYMSFCKALRTDCLLSLTESHGLRLNTARYMSEWQVGKPPTPKQTSFATDTQSL